MTNAEIVSKLWNLCNVLRDDGITYHQYVTELTYILFLKMAKETGSEKNIPEDKAVKVIMTTALNEERNVKMAFELGCTIYSGKPIDQGRFEQALRKLNLI